MTSVKIKFDYFSLLFVDCDRVYDYVMRNGGNTVIIGNNLLEDLKNAKVYINIDYTERQKRIDREKKYGYNSQFKVTRDDVLSGCYDGLFNVDIDTSLDISSMTADEAELFLMLKEYVPYDENIDVGY